MNPGDIVEVRQILAGGPNASAEWCDGYVYTRAEPAGTVIVKHTRGTYEGCEARFNASDVRPDRGPEIARETLALAVANQDQGDMASSAKLAASDASKILAAGQYRLAYRRAMTSLHYSVGILSADYQRAKSFDIWTKLTY